MNTTNTYLEKILEFHNGALFVIAIAPLYYVANFQTGYYLTKGIVIFVDSEFLRRPLLGEIRYSGRIGFKFLLDR